MENIVPTLSSIPTLISQEWLTKHGACEEQQAIIRDEWPDGMALTSENLNTAIELGFDILWFMDQVLEPAAFDDYIEKYKRRCAEYTHSREVTEARYREKRHALNMDQQDALGELCAKSRVLLNALDAEYLMIPKENNHVD